jgi:hypothetical protein
MGWVKDVFNPKGAEADRYDDLLAEKRKTYPLIPFDVNVWKNLPPSEKLKQCNALKIKVGELRLLKEGKITDNTLSNGFRVDERYVKVYTLLYDEYNKLYTNRQCDTILNLSEANKDQIFLLQKADAEKVRIEEDTKKNRQNLLIFGGVVLLIGSVLILRNR